MSRNESFVYKIPHLENNAFLQLQPKPVSIHTPAFEHSRDYSRGKYNSGIESNRKLNSYKEIPVCANNRHTTEKVHMLNVSLHALTGMLRNKRKRISSALDRLRDDAELSTSKQYLDTSLNSTLSQTHQSKNYHDSIQDYILELQDFSFSDENFDPNQVYRISEKRSCSSTVTDKAIQATLLPSKSILKKPSRNFKTQTLPSKPFCARPQSRACGLNTTIKSRCNKSFI
jgi:hypothetical protein